MRKFIILTGAFVAVLASCTKTATVDTPDQEIVFQMARRSAQTRVEDYKNSYQNIPFGTYAWFKGENSADNTDFMVNQSVSYDAANNRWVPTGTTSYWPKSGSLDFISYSPYTADGKEAPAPVVTENGISYPAWNVDANPDVDVMYADKVTGQTGNSNTYFYTGVPTLFRHALARVAFNIKASYLKKEAETGDVTRWEVTVNSITLNNILSTGSLDLSLDSDGSWKKPDDNVWDPEDDVVSHSFDIDDANLTTDSQIVGEPFLVLPQLLDGSQTVTINVTIKTYRDNNDGQGEKLVLTETGVDITASLANDEITAWGINQSFTYQLNFSPSLSDDGTDPVEIWFDPAVDDWEEVTIDQIVNL